MILRIGAGDLNAVVGLFGLVAGIGIGSLFIKKGFSLPRNYQQSAAEGLILPAVCWSYLCCLLSTVPFSNPVSKGGSRSCSGLDGNNRGLIIGVIIQRTRFCFIGMAKISFCPAITR